MDILMQECFEYATCRFYRITTNYLTNVYGILLNYTGSHVTLLTEGGLIKMPQQEILTMRPSNGDCLLIQNEAYIDLLEKCGVHKRVEECPDMKEDDSNGQENI